MVGLGEHGLIHLSKGAAVEALRDIAFRFNDMLRKLRRVASAEAEGLALSPNRERLERRGVPGHGVGASCGSRKLIAGFSEGATRVAASRPGRSRSRAVGSRRPRLMRVEGTSPVRGCVVERAAGYPQYDGGLRDGEGRAFDWVRDPSAQRGCSSFWLSALATELSTIPGRRFTDCPISKSVTRC